MSNRRWQKFKHNGLLTIIAAFPGNRKIRSFIPFASTLGSFAKILQGDFSETLLIDSHLHCDTVENQ